jgi:hypothetical protein
MATKEEVISLLYEIHEELARYYLKKLRKGELTGQDQKNLIQFLKDNHINTEVRKGTPLEELLNEDFSALDELDMLN